MRVPLARDNSGTRIHRASCRYARIPWNWADRHDWWRVTHIIEHFGYRYCRICKPEETLQIPKEVSK